MPRRWLPVLLAFSVIFYLAAPILDNNFGYLLAGLYFSAALYGVLTLVPPRQLSATVAAPDRLTAGDACGARFIIRNGSFLPRAINLLAPVLADGLGAVPAAGLFLHLPARGEAVLSVRLTAARRGRYPLGELAGEYYGFAGFVPRTLRLGSPRPLIVHPRPLPDGELQLLVGSLREFSGDSYQPVRQGEEFRGVREYQPGDSWRRIHWRTTARTGAYMVIEAESPAASVPFIVLDATGDDSARSRTGFEYSVRVAATLVEYFCAGSGCGLRIAGGAGGTTASGTGHAALIDQLDLLAGAPYAGPPDGADRVPSGGNGFRIVITQPDGALFAAPPAGSFLLVNDLFAAAAPPPRPPSVLLSALGLRPDPEPDARA